MKDNINNSENKKPKVSVIIPTYNRAHMVKEAIKSVLKQTYENFELIIIDDGSTDNTEQVVEEFKDKRIRYIKHKKNRGGGAARNTGLNFASGQYIAFLDSDDRWKSDKLEKQLKKIENSDINAKIIYTGAKIIDNINNKVIIRTPKFRGKLRDKLLKKNILSASSGSSVLIDSKCFKDNLRFDENLPSRQDLDMWLKLSKKYKFEYIKEPLIYVKRHEKRITANKKAKYIGRILLLRKIYDELNKNELSNYYRETGKICFVGSAISTARKYFLKSFYLKPSILGFIYIILTLLNENIYLLLIKIKNIFKDLL